MAHTSERQRSAADYTVACICPMGVELASVEGMLDEIHDSLPTSRDQNAYTLGTIGGHCVVVAIMPETGNNAAATVATQLLNDFPTIRFGLLVGIGGGVPGDVDVRLGDLVVSQPTDTFGGVVQYDLGKRLVDGRFHRTGLLNKPPQVLSANVRKLDGQHRRLGNQLSVYLRQMLQRYPKMQADYSFPSIEDDHLYLASYPHQPGIICDQCDRRQTVPRSARSSNEPHIHYGTIGSANIVVKDAVTRDELKRDMNILCVEMEAAGLMNNFPCLVIRGICDYADSHKNKSWQPYAAAVAAAYMKELLLIIPPQQVTQTQHAAECTTSQVAVGTKGQYLYQLADVEPAFRLGLHLGEAPIIDSSLFIGRVTELKMMEEMLQPDSGSREQRRVVLGGMGGIGKTQLAIAYAKHHCSTYESIFWLNAASELTLKKGLRSMVERVMEVKEHEQLDEEQTMLRLRRWLSDTRNSRWLLVFDNYDEPDALDLGRYLPYTYHGSIIITTRLPDQVSGKSIHVRPLEGIDHSLHILATRSKRDGVYADVHAQRLAKRLAGLPLALATAGAYLQKARWSFERYLQEYEERWNISPRRPLYLREYQDRTLYTTWDLSYKRLEKEDPEAAQLLKLLAYFDHQAVWYELFHAGMQDDLPEWLIAALGNDIDFDGIMRVLVDYCFLEIQLKIQAYSVHTCVHDWTLASLNKTVDSRSYWYAFDCVARSIADEEWESLEHLRHARLTSHAMRLTHSRFHEVGQEVTDPRIVGAVWIAQLLHKQIQLGAASLMLQRALSRREEALGLEHTSTLNTVNNLGALYSEQGKLDKAKQMYKRALAGYEKALGREHTSALMTVHNLGLLYADQSKLEEAEQMYNRALAGYEKALGPEHTSTLMTVNNLGTLYCKQGKLDKAKQMYNRALAGYEKALGPEHTSTLMTVENLGLLYANQGKLEEAEQMYNRALAGNEKALGREHTSTLRTVNNLGSLYTDQGKLEEAEQMYKRALAGYEKALGREHTSTLRTVNNLGGLYHEQGKLEEAEEMYKRVLAGYEKALGREHTSTLMTVHNLGLLYANQGKLEEAEQMYKRALAGYEKALGPEHTSTLMTVNNLGTLYCKQGKLDKAKQMYNRALAGYEKALGREHTSTLRTVNNLGSLYTDQGKLEEAEQMYKRALAGYEKALGREHTSTLRTVNNLGGLYHEQGKLEEAEEMYKRVLAGYEKALGREHTSTLMTVHNLGLLYADQSKLEEAEQIYNRALAGYEKALGREHTSTLDTVNNLGGLYRKQGKLEEAEQIHNRALAGYEKALGREHTSTLRTVNNLGSLYIDQSKLAEAEQMYNRALAGNEKALGREHTSTLRTVNNLGSLYTDQSKLAEAEQMYNRALAGYEKALGREHTSTLRTVNNLGGLYHEQGKLEEAEEMYKRVLAGYEKALGREHTSTLMTVHNLGLLYADQSKLEEAEQIYNRALAGYEKALGREHTSTLDTVNNLGLLYADQGKLEEAEEMYVRALAGYEKVIGPEHTSTLRTVNNLGGLYREQGKLEEAEEMYVRALAGREKALGREHTSTLTTVNDLGALYCDQGKLNKAKQMYERTISIYQITFSDKKSPSQADIRGFAAVLSMSIRTDDFLHLLARARLARLIQHVRDWGKGDRIVMYYLGKALTSSKDDNNAQTAFLHSIDYSSSPADFGGVRCDGCHYRVNVDTGLHTCQQCANIDLCNDCMCKWAINDLNLPTCRGHEYFDVGTAVSQAPESSAARDKLDMDLWIDELKKQYRVEAGR